MKYFSAAALASILALLPLLPHNAKAIGMGKGAKGAKAAKAMGERGSCPADWPYHSYDLANTNFNACEIELNARSVRKNRFFDPLEVAFDRFNTGDGPGPTGFFFEDVLGGTNAQGEGLGLKFRSSVMGVVASPLVIRGTLYYVDVLGTLHKCDSKTGSCSGSGNKEWTVKLADPFPGFDISQAFLPSLFYTAPAFDTEDEMIYIIDSVYGTLHVVDAKTGQEYDSEPNVPGIQAIPFLAFETGFVLSSVLGDSVLVKVDGRKLYVTNFNVILDNVAGQNPVGLQVALDVTDLDNTSVRWTTKSIPGAINNPTCNKLFPSGFGAGASVGAGLAYDEKRGLIFGGTGQFGIEPYTGYPQKSDAREEAEKCGFVDRSDSMYAIDVRTGEFKWWNQFHEGDVFDLNCPVLTGPTTPGGPFDADVLSPPVMWTADGRDMVGVGSKGGLYKAVSRDTGDTIWSNQVSKATGLGGIQAGSAHAEGFVYVAGFQGIDDEFSDLQFNNAALNFTADGCAVTEVFSLFLNAFLATFAPSFWADVEDTQDDQDPATGMQIIVKKLHAGTGEEAWSKTLDEGAALRHVSVANNIVILTTTSGKAIFLRTKDGHKLNEYQTVDLNEKLGLGLGKPHHAGMNSGAVISDGMVYLGYGNQNEPSGGIVALKVKKCRDHFPSSECRRWGH